MEGVIWVGGLRHATPKAAVLRALAAVGVQGPVRVHFNRGTGTGQASSALATMPLPDITKALSLNTTFVPDLSDFPLRVEMAKGQPKLGTSSPAAGRAAAGRAAAGKAGETWGGGLGHRGGFLLVGGGARPGAGRAGRAARGTAGRASELQSKCHRFGPQCPLW